MYMIKRLFPKTAHSVFKHTKQRGRVNVRLRDIWHTCLLLRLNYPDFHRGGSAGLLAWLLGAAVNVGVVFLQAEVGINIHNQYTGK